MACGCVTNCGCNVISDTPAYLSVQLLGDEIHLAVIPGAQFVSAVDDTNCVALDVTGGELTSSLIIDPVSGDVTLTCGPGGLSAEYTGADAVQNLFIQETDPAVAYNYQWWEIDGFNNLVTMWVETGY